MKRMVRAFGFLCVLSQLVFATGKCTLAKGAYDRTDGALKGCQYSYSIEFCPRHHNVHEKEHLNSITFEVRSNMTKVGFVSTCALRNNVFASLVRHDFRKAVTATRILNMTTMEGTFRASMLYSVGEQNQSASSMLFSLHNNFESAPFEPLTLSFQTDLDSGVVSLVSPTFKTPDAPTVLHLEYPSHRVVTDDKMLNMHTKCDFNTLLSGQWNYDANNKSWRWKTHACDSELMTVDAFVDWCKKYELRNILFIGSSRTRTMLFDLLLFFGYTLDDVNPNKAHHHLTYNVRDKLSYDLTLHLHWLDNRPDRTNDNRIYSYNHNFAELKTHFAEINICTHRSSVPFSVPANFKHYSSNVDYASPDYKAQSSASTAQPYAVFFNMGIYEAAVTGVDSFKALVPDVVKFAYESCMGAIPTNTNITSPSADIGTENTTSTSITNKNLFFVRTEEAVDPSNVMFVSLGQVNDYMYHTIVPELNALLHRHRMPPITLLDSYHVSRGWKLWNTDEDDIHFYAREGVLYGSHVSHTMANIVLQQLVQTMEEKLHQGGPSVVPVAHSSGAHHTAHSHSFPSFSALPEYFNDALVPLEGRLLMSPHNHREMFLVHGGFRCPIPNWDAFLALGMDIRTMLYPTKEHFDAFPLGAPLPNVD